MLWKFISSNVYSCMGLTSRSLFAKKGLRSPIHSVAQDGHVWLIYRKSDLGTALAQELRDEFDIDVRVLGIMSSSRMLLSDTALDLSSWREQFQE